MLGPSLMLLTDDNPIFAEIEALLETGTRPELDEIEDTLTTGYAAALALEAERWRLERRIAEVAGSLGDGEGGAEELSALAQRLRAADAKVARLRGMLGTLRSRVAA